MEDQLHLDQVLATPSSPEYVEVNSTFSVISIDVVDLKYGVLQSNGDVKPLLKGINCSFKAGSLCALMGPSGAGKSTLLDMIADRKLDGVWSGDILVDGLPRTKGFHLRTAYVLQQDVHIATLTVEETLYFSAWTRVSSLTTRQLIQQRVDRLLDMLGLADIRKSIIGSAMVKGISGGQLKRLSIAVELVNLPDAIFLDEPTSGLDSAMALEVMTAVQAIVKKDAGKVCISTIHQPSPEIFHLFDDLVLLAAGRLVFSGPCAQAMEHFNRLGYTFDGDNPAEYIISVCGGMLLPEGHVAARTARDLEALFRPSGSIHSATDGCLKAGNTPKLFETMETSMLTQLHMLLARSWLAKVRDYADLKSQLIKNTAVGLLIGIVCYGQGDVHEPFYNNGILSSEVSTLNSVFFFAMVYTTVGNLQAIPYLCSQIAVYRRDLASHAYRPLPYWLSQMICTLPIQFFFHSVFIGLMFLLLHLPYTAEYFFFYLFIMFLINTVAFYSSLFLAAACNSEALAFSIFPVTFLFVSSFSGFSITLDALPPMWAWASYVSYGRWGYAGIMVNEWERFSTDDEPSGDGNGDILAVYGFDGFDKYSALWILSLYMAAFALLTFYSLQPPANRLAKLKKQGLNPSPSLTWLGTMTSQDSVHMMDIDAASDAGFIHHPLTDFSIGNIPFAVGCTLVFKDVSYSVTVKSKQKPLLSNVSGEACPGEMCALMGSSGAGKSTLLDVLAGRKNTGQLSGAISYNDTAVLSSAAYVMQDNVHISLLTVKETIHFAAELRLPCTWSRDKMDSRIIIVVAMLNLQNVLDTMVGSDSVRGISGGQLKRLSIAVEIINLPDIIFLDEPTTGLDSATALDVMTAVRSLANQHRTIIATIHQPSRSTFELFDKVLILANGRVCYNGESKKGERNCAVDYFTQSPWHFHYRPGSNPADFVVAAVGGCIPAADGSQVSGSVLANYFDSQQVPDIEKAALVLRHIHNDASFGVSKEVTYRLNEDEADMLIEDSSLSVVRQIYTLTHRMVIKLSRDRKATVFASVRHLIAGLFYGSIYFQLRGGSSNDVYSNRSGVFFFSLLFMIIGHQQSVPSFVDDRLLFYRERSAGAYGAFPYWISSWILQVPMVFVNVLLFAVPCYWLVGLREGAAYFGYFYIQTVMCSLVGLFSAGLVSAISRNTQAALSYFPVVMFLAVSFAGFAIFIPQFPPWLGNWAPYISYMRYALQGVTLNEFQDNPSMSQSSAYIDQLGYQYLSKTECAGIMLPFIGAYALAYLLALQYINFEKR